MADEHIPPHVTPAWARERARHGAQLGAMLEMAARNRMSVREDFMEAVEDIGFDKDRCEWGMAVRTSAGFPRRILGYLIVTLKDDGRVVLALE